MKTRLFFCFLLVQAACILTAFTQQTENPLRVETYKLANGLTVYLNEDHSLPTVFGAVAINAGSKQDPKDATGIAHYLEHMLFKGTTTLGTTDYEKEKPFQDSIVALYDKLAATTDENARKAIQQKINEQSTAAAAYSIGNEFDNLLKSIGSTDVNAFTSDEMTFYHNFFPPNQVEKWLDIYAHRFQNPVFRSFQAELEVVYEEKNRSMDNFTIAIFEKFSDSFYKNHPYGQQTTLGTVEHLKNPSIRKMYEFYNTYYVANNMALILSGDIYPEEIKPMIEKTFGPLKPGNVPPFPRYEEKPFQGREEITMRAAPVKVGAIGFRTVPIGHPDQTGLDVLNFLLFNEGETGLLNELVLEDKLMFAGSFSNTLNDHGSSILFFVPKLLGQSLKNAESLILDQIQKLRTGDFEEKRLTAAIQEMNRSFQLSLENPEDRAETLGDLFVSGQTWESYLQYPQKLEAITKTDIIRLASEYFGDNYLVLHSGRGFPKKTKLDKPGFKPVLPKDGVKSVYTKYFEKLEEKQTPPSFVDFEKDLTTITLARGNSLFVVPNPINDIFELEIRYEVGERKIKGLETAAGLMNYSGTENLDLKALKTKFQEMGCTYSVYSDNSYYYITLTGPEKSFEESLTLLNELINRPVTTSENLKVVVNQILTDRKISEKQPSARGNILMSYGLYGKNSDYLNRYGKAELKKLTTDQLLAFHKEAIQYVASVHYSGKKNPKEIEAAINRLYTFSPGQKPSESPSVLPLQQYDKPQVFFVNDKRAVQSQVYFYVLGDTYQTNDQPYIDAFNSYFGGGFSGLVVQEIREYRSLAYSASGRYRTPLKIGLPGALVTYIGCQADKTAEALEIMNGLVKDMPKKTDRIDLVRANLRLMIYGGKPGFRDLSSQVKTWKEWGYTEDPGKTKLPVYETLTFEDIVSFYQKKIQGKPVLIMIVGDKKRLDTEGLKKYGTFVEISDKEILKR
ncbi:MAG: insulinase family protein [Bacteroidia bacterium]|nr:insulinase family protein [Bacteroidia bacterium]